MCSWYSKMVIDERNQEKSDANMKPGSKVKRRSFHIFVKDFPSKCWRSTSPCKGKVVEKPKTRNRSRGHPDNKLLGEKATWGQRLQQSRNCWAPLQPGDMNRDVFFLEDLLKSQMAQPHHQGYQVVTFWKDFQVVLKRMALLEAFPSQRGLKDQMVETLAYLEKRKTFWRQTAASAKSKWIDDLFVCNL